MSYLRNINNVHIFYFRIMHACQKNALQPIFTYFQTVPLEDFSIGRVDINMTNAFATLLMLTVQKMLSKYFGKLSRIISF